MTLEGEPAYDVPEGTESEVRMPTGRPHPPEFKAKVVMQVISGEKTLNDVAAEYDLNPNLVRKWRNRFEQEAYRAFSATEDDKARERELAEHREEVDDLYRMIGQLTAERDYLQRSVLKRYGVDVDKDLPGRPGK